MEKIKAQLTSILSDSGKKAGIKKSKRNFIWILLVIFLNFNLIFLFGFSLTHQPKTTTKNNNISIKYDIPRHGRLIYASDSVTLEGPE